VRFCVAPLDNFKKMLSSLLAWGARAFNNLVSGGGIAVGVVCGDTISFRFRKDDGLKHGSGCRGFCDAAVPNCFASQIDRSVQLRAA
jgi:hypothetical protein